MCGPHGLLIQAATTRAQIVDGRIEFANDALTVRMPLTSAGFERQCHGCGTWNAYPLVTAETAA